MLKFAAVAVLVCLTISGCAVYVPPPSPGVIYISPYPPPPVYYGGPRHFWR